MFSSINKSVNDRRNGIKSDEGFTLIELLVVVIIIGILAAIAIPVYLGIQNNAKDSAVKSDVSRAKTAVVAYQTDRNGAYPTSLTGLDAKYGYTPVAGDPNYVGGSAPAFVGAVTDAGFCIQARSTTGKIFSATANAGVVEAACGASS